MHNLSQNSLSQNTLSQHDNAQTLATESSTWFVYMIETDKKTLYTGIATDLARRFDEHLQTHLGLSRLGAKYFRGRRPLRMVYHEVCESRSAASRREYALKQLSAKAKWRLIDGMASA